MMGGLALIAMIPLGIGVFVGYVMCAFVPAKSQARVPIIVALSITVVSGILWLLQSVGTAMQSHGMVIGLGLLRMLLYAGQMVSFSLFMKAAATFVRRDDLGKMAMVVMGGLLVTPLFGYLAIIAVPFFGSEVDPVVGMVALGIAGIFGLAFIVFWVMQLFLMFRLGSAMKNR